MVTLRPVEYRIWWWWFWSQNERQSNFLLDGEDDVIRDRKIHFSWFDFGWRWRTVIIRQSVDIRWKPGIMRIKRVEVSLGLTSWRDVRKLKRWWWRWGYDQQTFIHSFIQRKGSGFGIIESYRGWQKECCLDWIQKCAWLNDETNLLIWSAQNSAAPRLPEPRNQYKRHKIRWEKRRKKFFLFNIDSDSASDLSKMMMWCKSNQETESKSC